MWSWYAISENCLNLFYSSSTSIRSHSTYRVHCFKNFAKNIEQKAGLTNGPYLLTFPRSPIVGARALYGLDVTVGDFGPLHAIHWPRQQLEITRPSDCTTQHAGRVSTGSLGHYVGWHPPRINNCLCVPVFYIGFKLPYTWITETRGIDCGAVRSHTDHT